MFKFIRKSLHAKILLLIIGIMIVGVLLSVYWELKDREKNLLEEKLRASNFIAKPVLNAIYEDMLEERADMARHLINSLSQVEGIELRIIRSNGVEEAFRDFKTINEVKKEFGEVRPEWISNHPDDPVNRARGVDTEEFKKAYSDFKKDWKRGPAYYIDSSGPSPVFNYLQPIEKKSKCNTCHTAEGARGILMISTPLDEMYHILNRNRNQWAISGFLAVAAGGMLISMLIKRSVTGPVKKNVEVIKRIAEGRGDMTERVEVTSEDEIGYLTSAFNSMLDTLEKRDEENKKLFHLVEKSKEEWVATFDSIQDFISIHDREDRVLKVNKALARTLSDLPVNLLGRSCHEVFYGGSPSHQKCPHARTLATGEVMDVEVDGFVFDGTYKVTTFPIFNEAGKVWACVHIARDVTLEQMLREQLLHAEKLSSVGKLVAGIAHELNNPLMGIMGFSQILMDTEGDTRVEEIKDKLDKIYHESIRTAKIVQNLLTFARAKKTEREYVDINEIIRHTNELRGYSLKASNIAVTLDLDKGLPMTMADKYQMQQVFVNIINNAEDAMVEDKGRGELEIKTAKSRGKIEITFTDNGPGVPKEMLHKVFDPFFTTKEVGKGTGLGLSITHGIITEHGGTIDIRNNPGGGAVITIRLPIVEKELWAEIKRAVGESVSEAALETGQNVLIADDEQSIREALSGILSKEGFTVDTAGNGREALDALGALDGKKYTLIIIDVKMPVMNGIELYGAIEKEYPHLKDRVIMVTGDVFSQEIKDFLAESGCPYFLKPFEPRELMRIISKVLSKASKA